MERATSGGGAGVVQHSLQAALPYPSLVSSSPFPCSCRPLTCGLPAAGFLQIAQRARIVTQVVESNAGAVGGLEVALLLLQHLEAVLANPLIVHQLRLQQAGCGGTGAVLSEPGGTLQPSPDRKEPGLHCTEPPPFPSAEPGLRDCSGYQGPPIF